MSRRGWIAQIASLLSALGLGGGFALQAFETSACFEVVHSQQAIVRSQQASYDALVNQVAKHSLGHP